MRLAPAPRASSLRRCAFKRFTWPRYSLLDHTVFDRSLPAGVSNLPCGQTNTTAGLHTLGSCLEVGFMSGKLFATGD